MDPELPDEMTNLPTGEIRQVILQRVQLLASNIEVHIPVALRGRHAAILAGLLTKMANGNVDACFLEEIRSKLLLSIVPKGRNRRVELS